MTKEKKNKSGAKKQASAIKTPLLSKKQELTILVAIILLALAVRLLFLFSPLLDFHSQRQTQTADTARNYYQYDMNFFNPRFMIVDINGDAPGVTGMEFPAYQYTLALLYKVFGVHDFFGRLLSVIFGLGVLVFTFLLGKKYIGTIGGLFAALFYAINPVAVFFNRTYQPDTAALFFLIAGIYFLLAWFDEMTSRNLALASAATTLGVLIKPPYLVVIVLIFAYKIFSAKLWTDENRANLWRVVLVGALSIGVAYLWYYYAYDIIFERTGLILRRGAYPGEHVRTWEYWLNPLFYIETVKRIILILTPLGAAFFAISLWFVALEKKTRVFLFGFLGYLAYFIFFAEYNIPHYYYQLPLIPIAALCLGVLASTTWDWIKKDTSMQLIGSVAAIVSISIIAWLSYQTARPWYNQASYVLMATDGLKKEIKPGSIVRMNAPAWSDAYYYLQAFVPHVIYDEEIERARYVKTTEERIAVGTEYGVWIKYQNNSYLDDFNRLGTVTTDTPMFTVWKLDKHKGQD